MKELIKPRVLKKGSTVAVVTPSWAGPHAYPERYELGKKVLAETFGVHIIEAPHALLSEAELQANPELRAADLMWAFKNKKVDAIIASIGGEDAVRLAPFVDYDVIQKNPKILMGYSDTTSVHLMCFKAGLSSFYGPAIMNGLIGRDGALSYTVNAVQKTLFSTDPMGIVEPGFDGWEIPDWNDGKVKETNSSSPWEVLQGSQKVTGRLFGGCFEVLQQCMDYDFFPESSELKDIVLFIEPSEDRPTEESLYNFMTALDKRGILKNVNAVLMGRPAEETPLLHRYDQTLLDVLRENNMTEIPVITQMDFGHTDPIMVLPYGMLVEVDPRTAGLTFLEPAVLKHIPRHRS